MGFFIRLPGNQKAIIHYTTYTNTLAHICATICCLHHESMLVSESQKQSADFGQLELTDFIEKRLVYYGHRKY